MPRQLTAIATTSPFDCLGGKCPAIFLTESGSYVVQGNRLSISDSEILKLPASQAAIEIPGSLVRQLLDTP